MAAVLAAEVPGCRAVLRLRGGVDQFNMNDGFRNERPSPMAIKRCERAHAVGVHARRHVCGHTRCMLAHPHAARVLECARRIQSELAGLQKEPSDFFRARPLNEDLLGVRARWRMAACPCATPCGSLESAVRTCCFAY